MWITLQDFITLRLKQENVDVMDPNFIEQEIQLFDSRNFYAKGATFNYQSSHQLSVAISKMQGLTNSIRVLKINYYIYNLISLNDCFFF